MENELKHVGSTLVYLQSTLTSARLFFKNNVDLCAEVQMPWDPKAVQWCARKYQHAGDHDFSGGPAPFPTHSGWRR